MSFDIQYYCSVFNLDCLVTYCVSGGGNRISPVGWCVCVCNSALSQPNRLTYGKKNCLGPFFCTCPWAKGLYIIKWGRCINAQAFFSVTVFAVCYKIVDPSLNDVLDSEQLKTFTFCSPFCLFDLNSSKRVCIKYIVECRPHPGLCKTIRYFG